MTHDFKLLTQRFLSWNLPKSVCSDLCVTNRDYQFPRSGTNLLTGDEAEAMLRHVLAIEENELPTAVREDLARRTKSGERWVIACPTAFEMCLGHHEKTYAILPESQIWDTRDQARDAIATRNLPVGWIPLELSRLFAE